MKTLLFFSLFCFHRNLQFGRLGYQPSCPQASRKSSAGCRQTSAWIRCNLKLHCLFVAVLVKCVKVKWHFSIRVHQVKKINQKNFSKDLWKGFTLRRTAWARSLLSCPLLWQPFNANKALMERLASCWLEDKKKRRNEERSDVSDPLQQWVRCALSFTSFFFWGPLNKKKA